MPGFKCHEVADRALKVKKGRFAQRGVVAADLVEDFRECGIDNGAWTCGASALRC